MSRNPSMGRRGVATIPREGIITIPGVSRNVLWACVRNNVIAENYPEDIAVTSRILFATFARVVVGTSTSLKLTRLPLVCVWGALRGWSALRAIYHIVPHTLVPPLQACKSECLSRLL